MTIRSAFCGVLFGALLVSGPASAADLLVNGGFEAPDITGSVEQSVGSTFINGWTVVQLAGASGNIQINDNAAFSGLGVYGSEGSQYLDLTGTVGRGGGMRSDAFATTAGAHYTIGFDVGAFWVAGYGSFGNATVDLYIGDSFAQSFTNNMDLSSPGSDWQRFSYDFAGTGSAMSVALFSSVSASSSDLGVGLDDVVVAQSPVPEPASWALMIGGFALAGGALRRRANQVMPLSA